MQENGRDILEVTEVSGSNMQTDVISTTVDAPLPTQQSRRELFANKLSSWYVDFKNALSVYIPVHLAFFAISCLAVLFTVGDFSTQAKPLYTLWQSWDRWDTDFYISIPLHGYNVKYSTAFFPLYSILIRAAMVLIHSPFVAGLLISDLACLGALIVLYRLVREDFDTERAWRAILYLSLFPTAFFLAAAYNEALFLFLSLLSFYQMRHGCWWLAGLFGFLAGLTRLAGIFLLIPFCYEYLQQHQFKLRNIRCNVLSGLLIPMGVGIFSLYCYMQFGDLLAFSHAQQRWSRQLEVPWYGIVRSFYSITHNSGYLSFQSLRNVLDLIPVLLFLALAILSFVGPWRFPRRLLSYGLYAAILYFFFLLSPVTNLYPLVSLPRFMLELFPGFIILADVGKNRMFHMTYLMLAGTGLFFLLMQFLTGHWIV
ncbi:MAG: hypothetical protein E6I80_29930 [Chloroflexi bacterium]|nr:MAG: hypothetical protein E6I80_29930 [Chloroflexota bacterium]